MLIELVLSLLRPSHHSLVVRGLQQIISIPLSPLHYSLVVGELQQMLILYNPLVSAILFTIYRL